MVDVFLVGLGIGLCLLMAAAVIFCVTGFKCLTLRDIEQSGKGALSSSHVSAMKWRKLILNQDKVVSTFFVAYLFLVITASTAMAYFWLVNMPMTTLLIHILCVTAFILLMTYFLPKSYVLRQESGYILKFGLLFQTLYAAFVLPAWLIGILGNNIAMLMRNHFHPMQHFIGAKQEMNYVVRYRGMLAAQDKDALEKSRAQRRMVTALDDYLKKTVADIMMPMADIPMIDGEQAMDVLLEEILNGSASRLLVYQENPDHIIGVLHVDLFLKAVALADGDLNAVDFVSALSEPPFIGPQTGVLDQINAFKQSKQGFALVRDVRGNWLGGISLDQLLDHTVMLLTDQDENASDTDAPSYSEDMVQSHNG